MPTSNVITWSFTLWNASFIKNSFLQWDAIKMFPSCTPLKHCWLLFHSIKIGNSFSVTHFSNESESGGFLISHVRHSPLWFRFLLRITHKLGQKKTSWRVESYCFIKEWVIQSWVDRWLSVLNKSLHLDENRWCKKQ